MSRITAIALEMSLPGLAGYWLDRRFGTSFLVLIGFALGLVGGMWHLLLITGAVGRKKKPPERDKDSPP